jgi:hypothetical protein
MDPGLMYKSRVSGSGVSGSPVRKSLGSVSWIRGVDLWGCIRSQYDSGIWVSGEKIFTRQHVSFRSNRSVQQPYAPLVLDYMPMIRSGHDAAGKLTRD